MEGRSTTTARNVQMKNEFHDMQELRIAAAFNECQKAIDDRTGGIRGELNSLANAVYRLWQNQKMLCKRYAISPTELPFYKELEADAQEIEYRNAIIKAAKAFKDACLSCPDGDIDCLRKVILDLPETPNKRNGAVEDERA